MEPNKKLYRRPRRTTLFFTALFSLTLFVSIFAHSNTLCADETWSDDWKKTLADARVDASKPILIKYEASWCGPCKMLTQEMESEDIKPILDGFHLLRIDVDRPPKGVDVEGINSLPTMRVITNSEEIIHQQVGLIQGNSLSTWLEQCESVYKEIIRRRKFAKQLSSGVLDDKQADLLLEMLQDRSTSQRSTAIELLVRYPQLVATKVIDILSAKKMRSRVAALDLLRRWPAPIEGIDPWQIDTVTPERITALKTWAASISSDDPEQQTDSKLMAEATPESIAEATLEIDRLLRRGPIREGLIDGLAVIGPQLLPNVTERLKTEASDTARERLSAVHYRLVASPTLSIRLPGATDKLASLDSSPRRIAAQLLSEQAQKDDVPLLETLFAHNDPLIREMALRGLQKSGGGETTELVRFLKDPDKNVRAAVLKLWLDNPRGYLAKPISENAMTETDPGLLVYYVRLLKEIGSNKDESFDALAKLAGHEDWQVRAEVAEAISHYTEENDSHSGPKVLHLGFREPARQLLKDKDSFVLSKIVPAIIAADQKKSFDQLLSVAWNHPQIRSSVLPKLNGSHHDEDDVKFLVERFESDQAGSRSFALEAMSRLRVDEHEVYIRKGFDDDDADVQLAAVRSLNSWLDSYHSELPVLPGAPSTMASTGFGGSDPFGGNFDDGPFFEPEPASSGILGAIGALFGGGQAKAPVVELSSDADAATADEVAEYTKAMEAALEANSDLVPVADPTNDAAEAEPVDEAAPADEAQEKETDSDDKKSDDEKSDDEEKKLEEEDTEAETYEQWLTNWRKSPSAVLPWLEGTRPVVERLYKSDDPVTKAHASLAAVRLGIEIAPSEVIESVSALPDSTSRLGATYRWLPKESRSELLFFSAKTEDVDDYLPAIIKEARKYDKSTIVADTWKSLDMIDPQHVGYGYYIRQALMQVMTGKTYYSSQSEKATAKIADRIVESVSQTKTPFARMMGISLLGDVDADRVDSLVANAYKDDKLDEPTRRDWARMALGAKGKKEATELAASWLDNETFLTVALDYIAEGHTGISQTEVASIEVPNAGPSVYSRGKITVPQVDAAIQPAAIKSLLDHKEPEIVAKATYLLIVMGEETDIAPLEKIFRSEGIDPYLSGWTDLYLMAIAMRNDDSNVTVLEEIYEKLKDRSYRAKEFYWKIRIMTGSRALKLRKLIRDDHGMDNLI